MGDLRFPYVEVGIKGQTIIQIILTVQIMLKLLKQKFSLELFLRAKYYQRVNLVAKTWENNQSLVWKHLMLINRRLRSTFNGSPDQVLVTFGRMIGLELGF